MGGGGGGGRGGDEMDKGGHLSRSVTTAAACSTFLLRGAFGNGDGRRRGGGRERERFKVLKNIILCLPGCLSACLFKGSEIKSSILFFSQNVRAIPLGKI